MHKPHEWRDCVYARAESPIEDKLARQLLHSDKFVIVPDEHLDSWPFEYGTIAMCLQYKLKRYRLDMALCFLDVSGDYHKVNVECDGAKWHEPEHCRRRDAERDFRVRAEGFKVWRYPGWLLHYGANEAADEIERAIWSIQQGEEPILTFSKARRDCEPTEDEWYAAYFAFWSTGVWPNHMGPTPKERGWLSVERMAEGLRIETRNTSGTERAA